MEAAQESVQKWQGLPRSIVATSSRSPQGQAVIDAWRIFVRTGNKALAAKELGLPYAVVSRWLRAGEKEELEDGPGKSSHVVALLDADKVGQIRADIAMAPGSSDVDKLRACTDEARRRGWDAPTQSVNLTLVQQVAAMPADERRAEIARRMGTLAALGVTIPTLEGGTPSPPGDGQVQVQSPHTSLPISHEHTPPRVEDAEIVDGPANHDAAHDAADSHPAVGDGTPLPGGS